MIIHPPTIKEQDNILTVSAAIEVERNPLLSTTIWYKFPAAQREFVSDRSDSFLVGLVFLAMKLGEDITVEGVVSPRVVQNLTTYQNFFLFHFPTEFTFVTITALKLEEDAAPKELTMSSFSGGIDSWYTLSAHRTHIAARDTIKHCLFIGGFDLRWPDPHITEIKNHYRQLLSSIGVTLLVADTNLSDYLNEQVYNNRTCAAVLASVFLALNKNTARVLIPSGHHYAAYMPFFGREKVTPGTNPLSDSLLSTETTTFFHHGSTVSRIEKTLALANYPLTYDNLRICWWPEGIKNCCQCSKCLRTMLTLTLSGDFPKYKKSFSRAQPRTMMKGWVFHSKIDEVYGYDLIRYALKQKRPDIALRLSYLLLAQERVKKMRLSLLHKKSRLKRSLRELGPRLTYPFFHLSQRLKQVSPRYTRLVAAIKGQTLSPS